MKNFRINTVLVRIGEKNKTCINSEKIFSPSRCRSCAEAFSNMDLNVWRYLILFIRKQYIPRKYKKIFDSAISLSFLQKNSTLSYQLVEFKTKNKQTPNGGHNE